MSGEDDERRRVRADALIRRPGDPDAFPTGSALSTLAEELELRCLVYEAAGGEVAVHLGHALVRLAVPVLPLGVPLNRVSHSHSTFLS